MDSTLQHYVRGQDFGTLTIEPDRDDDIVLRATGRGAVLEIPLYAHQAREIIEILTPLAAEEDQ